MKRRLLVVVLSTVFILTAYVLAFGINNGEPTNVLMGIEALQPGQDIAVLRGLDYSCSTAYMAHYSANIVCSVHSVYPYLQNVIVTSGGSVIESISASPVRGRVTLGHLIALWGEPERYYRHKKMSRAFWPGRSATMVNGSHHMTMFTRVVSILIFDQP